MVKLEQFQKDGREIWDKLGKTERHRILELDPKFKELIGTSFDIANDKFMQIHKANQRKIFKIMKELGL